MARQDLCVLPAPCLPAELPKLDLAIATAGDESSCSASLVSASTDNLARRNGWCPRNAVHAGAAGLEDLVCPRIVLELQNRNISVRGSAREEAAGLVRRPGDVVDGGGVERDIVDLLPGARLFAPNEDLAIVRGRGEDVAILGVRPSYAPNSAFMSVQLSTSCHTKGSQRRTPSVSRPACGFRPRLRRS